MLNGELWGKTSVKERVQYHYLPGGLDRHCRVGCCGVVTAHSQHDFDEGGAVSVTGFVWLLAVGTTDRGVVAGVSGLAVSDRARVVFGGVWLGTDSTGVVAGGAALGGVSERLAFVAACGGAERDVFGDGAFSVKHGEAGGTERLLGHFTDEGDDHGGSLLALTAVRAGEPSWCLTHS